MAAPKDITGERVGRLVAECRVGATRFGQSRWRWRCDCGKARVAVPSRVRTEGEAASCGRCERRPGKKPRNLTGRRFGAWTVLGPSGRRRADRHPLWLCRCDCGTVKEVRGSHLRGDASLSCPRCCNRRRGDGEAVRRARLRAGLTQEEAAARLGVTKQGWSYYEQAATLAPATRERIAAALAGGATA